MWRGAVIGFGNVAVHGHLPGWFGRADVEIVAVADSFPARRRACAEHVPRARFYDGAVELLDQVDVDFVDICTPPSSHAPLVLEALQRGLHVLCEKPLVVGRDELEAVTRGTERSGRVLHAVHNWHHAPIIRQTSALLADGAIGPLRHVVWQTCRPRPAATADPTQPNWRVDPTVAGGGVLTDHGWHVFYVLRQWLGAHPTSVRATLETRRHTAIVVEDTATLHLAFAHATAEVLLTWAGDRRANWAELHGDTGTIHLDDARLILNRGGTRQEFHCPPALSDGSTHPDWFEPVAAEFVAEMTGVRQSDSLAEASLCATIESTARESSRLGGIALPIRDLGVV